MVDAAFGEVMVTCEKISWLIREGERWLKPEKRSPGVMVLSCLCMHHVLEHPSACPRADKASMPVNLLSFMHPSHCTCSLGLPSIRGRVISLCLLIQHHNTPAVCAP